MPACGKQSTLDIRSDGACRNRQTHSERVARLSEPWTARGHSVSPQTVRQRPPDPHGPVAFGKRTGITHRGPLFSLSSNGLDGSRFRRGARGSRAVGPAGPGPGGQAQLAVGGDPVRRIQDRLRELGRVVQQSAAVRVDRRHSRQRSTRRGTIRFSRLRPWWQESTNSLSGAGRFTRVESPQPSSS
jgi:hypothetical protein